MENIVQTAILVLSGGFAFLIGTKSTRVRFWAFAVGLSGQPFWFWTAYTNKQWAVLLLSFWYTFCHLRGLWNTWHLLNEKS